MTELTDDELLNIWRINFAKTNKLFLDIARAAIAADRDLTATLARPADAPAAGADGPSDKEIMELMPQQMREDLAAAARAIAEQAGTDSRRAMGAMRIILNRHAVDLALAVLTRWGQPPAPPAEGEVAELARWLRLRNPIDMEGEPDDCTYFMLTRAAELLERHAAPVPVPGVAHTRYEFSVCDETGMEVAGGSAPTYAQALSEGRHYLAQYQQDEPHTLELRRVEVLDPGALPLPAPQGGEVEP